jgi:hypothetical protein
MRSSPLLFAALAAGAVVLLAGCSGSTSGGVAANLPGATAQTLAHSQGTLRLEATGIAPRFFGALNFGHHPLPAAKAKPPKALAVTDGGTTAVEILNKQYALTQTLTGFVGPDGDWYDSKGNLYVADPGAIAVQEFAKGATSPTTTYNAGLTDPIGVTTDGAGNVYVADYGDGAASTITEYAQGSNTVKTQCSTGLGNEGIAINNKTGDVFVDGNNPNTGSGNIVEYKGGLSGCSETTLGVVLGFAGGMQIDANLNLAAIDQLAGVDIIPPPYTSIGSTITGFEDPFHNALNKKQNLMFVVNAGALEVSVVSYPSGTPVTTLGSANGLTEPVGVAAYPIEKK